MPWQSLVENLESIRIAGQILFAMDMAARKKREFGRWRAVGSRTVQWRPGGGERTAASEVALPAGGSRIRWRRPRALRHQPGRPQAAP